MTSSKDTKFRNVVLEEMMTETIKRFILIGQLNEKNKEMSQFISQERGQEKSQFLISFLFGPTIV